MSRTLTVVTIAIVSSPPAPARAMDTLMPRIVHEACGEFAKSQPFEIRARFEDESQLFDPKVIYRTRTDSHWKHAPFIKDARTENFVATIRAKELRGPVEYFIEVFDEYGNGPARMGSPEAPIRVLPARNPEPCQQLPTNTVVTTTSGSSPANGMGITTPGPPPLQGTCDREDRPLYCEPWLWGTLGVVVAAGAGAAVYFFVLRDPDNGNDQVDSVKLIITGPDPTTPP
ncbi:hypothetical protein ACFL6C_06955 [Myxococcota bacterium]